MKPRDLLLMLTAALALALTSCDRKKAMTPVADEGDLVQVVELWVDAGPIAGEGAGPGEGAQIVRVASAAMRDDPARPDTLMLAAPLRQKLPSGLELEITCERASTGEYLVGISHDGELVSSGKYSGPFTLRMYPPGHAPYVLYIRDDVAADEGD